MDVFWERLRKLERRRASLLVLAAAMAVSTLTILYLGRGQSFTSDEWLYLAGWPGWSLDSLAHPDNGHLLVTANAILNASVGIFGSDYTPLRLVSVRDGEAGSRADAVIARALAIEAVPVTPPVAAASGAPVALRDATDASTSAAGACLRVEPRLGRLARVTVTVPPGGFSLRAARLATTAIALGRF